MAQAEALAPDSAEALLARALVTYYVDLDFKTALPLVRRARALRPNDARAWYNSALLERRLALWSDCLNDFRRARLLSPKDFDIVSEQAISLSTLRLDAEAGESAQAALALRPNEPSMLFLVWLAGWSKEGAAGGAKMLATLPQGDTYITALRARQAWYERDLPRALALWAQALARQEDTFDVGHYDGVLPGRVEWQLQYATALRASDPLGAQKQFHEVADEAEAALRQPGSKYLECTWRLAHAWALAGLGKNEEAVREAQRGVDLVPLSADPLEGPTFLEYQARALATAGEQEKAIDLLAKLLYTTGSWMTPARLAAEPTWDPLRNNPRFQALLKEKGVGLTPWRS
jgi:serine/threonine-protein kinase